MNYGNSRPCCAGQKRQNDRIREIAYDVMSDARSPVLNCRDETESSTHPNVKLALSVSRIHDPKADRPLWWPALAANGGKLEYWAPVVNAAKREILWVTI